MTPDKLENCAQCCFNKFDCRLFISKFIEIAFYLSLSLSVISKSLAQPWCKCYSLSVSIVLSVRFTTNIPSGCAWWTTPMWREQAEIKWSRRGIFIVAWCNSGKLYALAARPFQSQQSGVWPSNMIPNITRFAFLLLLRILRSMWRNHVATWTQANNRQWQEFGFKQDSVFAFSLYLAIEFWFGFESEKLKSLYWYLEKTQGRSMRPTAMIKICKYYIKPR